MREPAQGNASRQRPSRAQYVAFDTISTRWIDNDVYRHVNNAVYYTWIDSAVNRRLIESGALDIETSPVIGLVVESGCRYFASSAFPDVIHVGVRAGHVGTSSVRYEVGLFKNDEDAAIAEGFFVHVYVDRATQRPTPLPPQLRRVVEALRLPQPAGDGA
jgi:acyl-CoA thioester hydrolase